MPDATLFHTAQVHQATFEALRARIAPHSTLKHVVRPDWLARAQTGIDPVLSEEITAEISIAENALCTCTTIGPLAAAAGALRIDHPMMQAAAATGGPVLLAYCLDSTRAPSMALLKACFEEAGLPPDIRLLDLTHLWPRFEDGKIDQFHSEIAQNITQNLERLPASCVVLAQASMAGAAGYPSPIPVLASPEMALRAILARANP